MEAGKFKLGKASGGVLNITPTDGVTSTDLVLPLSGTVASVDTAVTDNAIARYDGATGKLQNSGVIIDDSGNLTSKAIKSNVGTDKNVATQASVFAVGGVLFSAYNDAISASVPLELNGSSLQFGTQNSERMRIDSVGNVGIGVTPTSKLQIEKTRSNTAGEGSVKYSDLGTSTMWSSRVDLSNRFKYDYFNGSSWTNFITLDTSGKLAIGATGSATKLSVNGYSLQTCIMEVEDSLNIQGANSQAYTSSNAAVTILRVGASSSRSINTSGTINASGNDYAEYEYSNDITIAKGQIVGFKADGTLTDKYVEAIRFAIKSTNPSIVGGDIWGIEDVVGRQPLVPVRKLDKTEQVQIEGSEEFETVVIEAGDTDTEWEAIGAKYKIDSADFEARLEAERQKVDRIAYTGKVPVNVYGAYAGQYIVAIEKDGGIDGLTVDKADMTFAQYQDAVGRVNKILDDGRAEVAVIIH